MAIDILELNPGDKVDLCGLGLCELMTIDADEVVCFRMLEGKDAGRFWAANACDIGWVERAVIQ